MVVHRQPLLSLGNCFTEEDLAAWYKRVADRIGEGFAMVSEPKIDGLAMALVYENGRFVQGATRAMVSAAKTSPPTCGPSPQSLSS